MKVIIWVRHLTTLNGCWRQNSKGKAGAAWHKWGAVCAQAYLLVLQAPCPCPWGNREGDSFSAMLVLCHGLPPGSLRQDRWGLFLPGHCHFGDSWVCSVGKKSQCFYDFSSKNLHTVGLIGKFQRIFPCLQEGCCLQASQDVDGLTTESP